MLRKKVERAADLFVADHAKHDVQVLVVHPSQLLVQHAEAIHVVSNVHDRERVR